MRGMNDQLGISQSLPDALPIRKQALSGYQASREVENRARVSRPMEDPELQRAAAKLDQRLESGKPLRDDVPRWFYLNVRV